ncbi:TPA: hypothetical protein N0F65_012691 [Lagenidium giganteum]|uniref:Ankyrin repeat domain-containing protein n=1 Tax=Lagenidium giganteum TaxID=4803 RepID=A0AAV2YE00_9STRA|nr:TPA: hypothetical protein N0F65_012691 [Lagenidium giganteum]
MAPPEEEQSGHRDLCLLVNQGDIGRIRALLAENPELINRKRWSGVGPLHRAVDNGDMELARLLLSHGADANERAAWGWYTPLHLACKHGHEEMIRLLLDHGANWSVTDKHKKTPLQWAVRVGKASVAYRIDQQLHAKAKQERITALEADIASRAATPLSFASLS